MSDVPCRVGFQRGPMGIANRDSLPLQQMTRDAMKRGGKEFFIGGKISHTRVRALLVGVYENKETHLCGPWPIKRTSTMLTLCLKFLTRPRPLPTAEPLALSSTAVTAAENLLMRIGYACLPRL